MAVFIASHYRATIANDTSWNSAIALSLVRNEARQFAERSVAAHPAPTKEEIAEADAALQPYLPQPELLLDFHTLTVLEITLAIYVCLPALIAAPLFRGGLALRMASVIFVRRDGRRASRLRVFWRVLVAWVPFLFVLLGSVQMIEESSNIPLVDPVRAVLWAGDTLRGFARAWPARSPRRDLARAAVVRLPWADEQDRQGGRHPARCSVSCQNGNCFRCILHFASPADASRSPKGFRRAAQGCREAATLGKLNRLRRE